MASIKVPGFSVSHCKVGGHWYPCPQSTVVLQVEVMGVERLGETKITSRVNVLGKG